MTADANVTDPDKRKRQRTTRDALIHDALDDLGLLIRAVDLLDKRIDGLPANLEPALATVLKATAKNALASQAAIEKYGNDVRGVIKDFTAKEMEKAAQEMLAAVAKDLKEATALHRRAVSEASGTSWRYIAIVAGAVVLAGLVSGGAVLAGFNWWYVAEMEKRTLPLQFGQALFALDKVDPKLMERLQAEVFAQGACRKEAKKGQ